MRYFERMEAKHVAFFQQLIKHSIIRVICVMWVHSILVQFLPYYLLHFRKPLLSGQLAISRGWSLNRGLTVFISQYWIEYIVLCQRNNSRARDYPWKSHCCFMFQMFYWGVACLTQVMKDIFQILTSVVQELTSAALTLCVTTPRDHTIARVIRDIMGTGGIVRLVS